MSAWLLVGVLGGFVGLDTTSCPQMMISRPLVAGTLTGAVFGRPLEGMVLGFVLEAFALITLPIGAARYPEHGTATVAGISAYMAVVEAGIDPGVLALALAFALSWEWLAGETVVLLRHRNGRVFSRPGGTRRGTIERRHLVAMATDFARGGIVAVGGGLLGYGLIALVHGSWALPAGTTVGILTILTATMIAATLSLFGGTLARRVAWGLGLATGLVLTVVL